MTTRLSVLFVMLLMASPAAATTIDFGDAEFSDAAGEQSWNTTVDGVGVTISAQPADDGAVIEHSGDGLGVDLNDGWAAGEQIEGEEVLTIEFDQVVDVEELTVTNLYDWGIIQIEVGTYTVDGEVTEFTAESSNGTLTVPVDAQPTTTISFRASGDWSGWLDNGFTLESISFSAVDSVSAVPELDPNAAPAAVAFVVGSALLLSERRRGRA